MPRCLNCNTRVSQRDKYCPACGQPTDTRRYDVRQALTSGLASVMRFDSGLPHTLAVLFTRPWEVIRDMVAGKRARYTPAVKLLVILSFVYIIIGELMGVSIQGGDFDLKTSENVGAVMAHIMKFFNNSVIAQYLVLTVPATIALYIVGKVKGCVRYNMAECFMATCYYACLLMAVNIIFLPLETYVSPDLKNIGSLYLLVMAYLGVKHAYHTGYWRAAWNGLKLTGFTFVCSLVMVVLLALIIVASVAIAD